MYNAFFMCMSETVRNLLGDFKRGICREWNPQFRQGTPIDVLIHDVGHSVVDPGGEKLDDVVV